MSVYAGRPDLQNAFDARTYQAKPNSAAGFLIDLEDWAEQYGWSEYPEQLGEYRPVDLPPKEITHSAPPVVSSTSYIVIDRNSRKILSASNANQSWPIASLTKLATATVISNEHIDQSQWQFIGPQDDVGGAKLYVGSGDSFHVSDLMYAMLVGSANNAAVAISHSTGLDKDLFVGKMNELAGSLNLSRTVFADQSGMDTRNVSTAREVARIAEVAFEEDAIRRCTSTSVRYITGSSGAKKKMTNTNWMLYSREYDDVYVLSGKTGYLDESGWNFVVSIRPQWQAKQKELLIVTLGSSSRAQSFQDANKLADWIWQSYTW
ncbi:MAG: serine hydrolase [Patescibacteria group bacterium]